MKATTTIKIKDLPIAAFTANPTSGTTPLTVNFTNNSTNATSYLWEFGTGGDPSTEPNPTYVYTPLGSFTVTLTATNSDGDSVATQEIDVSVGGT